MTELKDSRFTISIHALREEGDPEVQDAITKWEISIHALREEGDGLRYVQDTGSAVFLSTPSARRATSLQHPRRIVA